MNFFVIGYYAMLIGASCLAAYYNVRSAFLLLFSLTLASFLIGIIGGESALWTMTIVAGIIALAAGVSYAFREFLVIILPGDPAKAMKTAPLTASFGLFIVGVYAITGIFAPVIAPFGEAEIVTEAFAPADAVYLLGGDQLGRDMFSRLVFGARNTVGLALVATTAAFVMGAFAGLLAATLGGWFDQVLGRFADVVMSIPSLIFALLMLSIFGTNVFILVIIVAIIYSPRVFRLTRAVAGNIVVMDYIEAARLRGEGMWYLIRKEILPNSTAPLIAEFGLEFCFVFLL
ncbi:MAG: ABC transporter permease, partial [Rhodospirillales bacterium]